ncbi:unnamed protein product, partial [Chrysoparadoxa australica]
RERRTEPKQARDDRASRPPELTDAEEAGAPEQQTPGMKLREVVLSSSKLAMKLMGLGDEGETSSHELLQRAAALVAPGTANTDGLEEGELLNLRVLTFNNLACWHRNQNDPDASLKHLQCAVGCFQAASALAKDFHGINQQLAVTHSNTCAILSDLDRHDEALLHAQSAVLFCERSVNGEPDVPEVNTQAIAAYAIACYNLGVELEFVEGASCIQWYTRALQLSRQASAEAPVIRKVKRAMAGARCRFEVPCVYSPAKSKKKRNHKLGARDRTKAALPNAGVLKAIDAHEAHAMTSEKLRAKVAATRESNMSSSTLPVKLTRTQTQTTKRDRAFSACKGARQPRKQDGTLPSVARLKERPATAPASKRRELSHANHGTSLSSPSSGLRHMPRPPDLTRSDNDALSEELTNYIEEMSRLAVEAKRALQVLQYKDKYAAPVIVIQCCWRQKLARNCVSRARQELMQRSYQLLPGLRREISKLKEEKSESLGVAAHAVAEAAQSGAEVLLVRASLLAMEQRVASLTEEAGRGHEKAAEVEAREAQAEEHARELRHELVRTRGALATKDLEHREEVESLQAKVAEAEQELERKEDEVENLKLKIVSTKRRWSASSENANELSEDVEALKATVASLSSQLQAQAEQSQCALQEALAAQAAQEQEHQAAMAQLQQVSDVQREEALATARDAWAAVAATDGDLTEARQALETAQYEKLLVEQDLRGQLAALSEQLWKASETTSEEEGAQRSSGGLAGEIEVHLDETYHSSAAEALEAEVELLKSELKERDERIHQLSSSLERTRARLKQTQPIAEEEPEVIPMESSSTSRGPRKSIHLVKSLESAAQGAARQQHRPSQEEIPRPVMTRVSVSDHG